MVNTAKCRLIDIVRERSFSTGGETKLVSGRSTRFYFDMKPSMLHPEGAQLMATLILDALRGSKVDPTSSPGMSTLGRRPTRRATVTSWPTSSSLPRCPATRRAWRPKAS